MIKKYDRNTELLSDYMDGMSVVDLAHKYSVSRERVRILLFQQGGLGVFVMLGYKVGNYVTETTPNDPRRPKYIRKRRFWS